MKWTRRMTTAAAAAVCLSATFALSAQAQTSPLGDALGSSPAAALVTPLTDAQRQDIALYAATHNLSTEAAIANFQFQDDFQRVADLLQERFPDRFSDSTFQGVDGTVASIGFKGAVPPLAEDLTKQLPIPVRLVSDRGLSSAELNAITTSMLGAFLDTYRTTSANLTIDPATLAVDVVYSGLPSLDKTAATTLMRDTARRDAPNATSLTFTFAVSEAPAATSELLSGGTVLTLNNGAPNCTAGFTVRNIATGQTGLLTAGHCNDNMRYEGKTNIPFTFAGHTFSSETDAQWHSSSDSVWNQFVVNYNGSNPVLRAATSRGGTSANAMICKYGRVSGAGCTTVRDLYHATNSTNDSDNDRSVPVQVAVALEYITQPGDSGGPWYYGNVAHGVHKGSAYVSLSTRSVFTLITRIENNSNLRVLLS